MKLTKHSHYATLLIVLFLANGFAQKIGENVAGSNGLFIVAAVMGFSIIFTVIAWIQFGLNKRKETRTSNN